jgi:hypothetical protein
MHSHAERGNDKKRALRRMSAFYAAQYGYRLLRPTALTFLRLRFANRSYEARV